MIAYPNNNVQSIGDQTNGRLVLIDNPTALTPRKLFSFIKEGFIPVAASESSGTVSYAFCSVSGYPSEVAESYTLTIGSDSFTSTGYDVEFTAGE